MSRTVTVRVLRAFSPTSTVINTRSPLVALRRQAERPFERALGQRTDRLCLGLAVLEQDHVRDREDAVAFRELLLLVVVDLDELQVVRVGDSLEEGGDCVAGRAPLGPEIDEHGPAALQ